MIEDLGGGGKLKWGYYRPGCIRVRTLTEIANIANCSKLGTNVTKEISKSVKLT